MHPLSSDVSRVTRGTRKPASPHCKNAKPSHRRCTAPSSPRDCVLATQPGMEIKRKHRKEIAFRSWCSFSIYYYFFSRSERAERERIRPRVNRRCAAITKEKKKNETSELRWREACKLIIRNPLSRIKRKIARAAMTGKYRKCDSPQQRHISFFLLSRLVTALCRRSDSAASYADFPRRDRSRINCPSSRTPRRNNCPPLIYAFPRGLGRAVRDIDNCSHHLGRLRETSTSQRQLSCRVYERSSPNAEYARAIPRVFSSRRTHARYAANAR